MVIAVNTRLLIKDKLEGIGWFTYEALMRITVNHPEHKFIFIFDRPFSDEFIFSPNIEPVIKFPPARHPILWYWWFEYSVPAVLKKYKADIFLSPDGFLSLSTQVPSVPVIHDLNFVHRPQDLPFTTRTYYNRYFPLFAKKAARIATVSEYSKKDISKSYSIDPGKIDVTYNGANSMYAPLSQSDIERTKKKYTGGEDYFVFIGALHPRKNVARLLAAFDEFKSGDSSKMKLVIVGGVMFGTGEQQKIYESMKHKNDVIFTGRLMPADLKYVLGSAFALTFVPFFEGFGIPVVEAMYCDVPVITSNVTSLPEVSGDAALLVNPFSVESIREGMLKLVKDKNLRTQLIEKARVRRQEFNWDNTATALWACIQIAVVQQNK